MPLQTVTQSYFVETVEANKLQKLIECKYYQVFHMKVEGQAEFEQEYPFLIVSVVEGNGLLNLTIAIRKNKMISLLHAGMV